ncbi:hypothetical protein BAJUN_03230 [Bajunvirus bajun]|uniref:DUF7831 domain-containing protein n=1 Tax=Brevundimonas phage vB_BgoS-Bajun TaxID=2948594 RepID=A0A9E7N6F0_9CAUD|nr:hypothetical protein BAJUN_03230 [Brevundimonas phage vB_BgoS-Bajun]
MPVLFQKFIKREDLIRNRGVVYIFGDNIMRRGMGGQAAEMRNEPNALGIATKRSPEHDEIDYFDESPEGIVAQKAIIDQDFKKAFEHVKAGGILIWPTDGIGTGISELPKRAPTTMTYIEDKLTALIRVGRLFDKGDVKGAFEMAKEHI